MNDGDDMTSDLGVEPPPRRRTNSVKTLDPIQEVRLDNLKVLTEQPGTKIRFGQIVGLSASNVSHRLHRIRVIDAEESRFYAERLGLPLDWFETRRSAHEVPRGVIQYLTSRTPVPPMPPRPRRARIETRGDEPPKRPRGRPRGSAKITGYPPAAVAPTTQSAVVTPAIDPMLLEAVIDAPAQPPGPPADLYPTASRNLEDREPQAPARGKSASPAMPAGYAVLDDLGEVQPIARELLKMVAIKSRQGKLDEMTALRLLGEVGQL